MHIGISINGSQLTIVRAQSGAYEVITEQSYSPESQGASPFLPGIKTCLENLAVSSIMCTLPPGWDIASQYAFYQALRLYAPEVWLVPIPIALLSAHFPAGAGQDWLWWTPWGQQTAYGFISFLPGGELTLEGYELGGKTSCIQAAQDFGYYEANSWHLNGCLRPEQEYLPNLIPHKLDTLPYTQDDVLSGLTLSRLATWHYLQRLHLVMRLDLCLSPLSAPGPAISLGEPGLSLELAYGQEEKIADFSALSLPYEEDLPVCLADPAKTCLWWSGQSQQLQNASLWLNPSTGQTRVISNSDHYFTPASVTGPHAALEARLALPPPLNAEECVPALQLMLHHLNTPL
jgi:hypothetical protein